MRRAGYVCDVCQTPKREVNRWWVLGPGRPGALVAEPWSEAEAQLPEAKHLCGVACLLRAVASWADGAVGVEELERLLGG